MQKTKVAACVVLYNPEDTIVENLHSYAHKVSYVILVDNSTTDNLALINKIKNNLKNIIYIKNNDNLGIATALNIGCEEAIKYDMTWVLTMDQDSKFINIDEYLKCLYNLSSIENIALLAPNHMWLPENHIQKGSTCEHQEKFLVITSGNLLNLSLFNNIGQFEEKLFIDMVDHDYCIRAQKLKYKIYYYPNIILQHSLGSLFQRKNLITRKVRNKIEHSPQRIYYITRNSLYIWQQYHNIFPKEFHLLKTLNILFIHEITKIILYEDQKWQKIKAKFLGLKDFFFNNYGQKTL